MERTAARGHPRAGGAGPGQCPGSGHSEGPAGSQTRIKRQHSSSPRCPRGPDPTPTRRASESKLATRLRTCLSFSTRPALPTCVWSVPRTTWVCRWSQAGAGRAASVMIGFFHCACSPHSAERKEMDESDTDTVPYVGDYWPPALKSWPRFIVVHTVKGVA